MTVTIRIERADGQFTVAQTDIPEVPPDEAWAQQALERKILAGFVESYRRCADLPA